MPRAFAALNIAALAASTAIAAVLRGGASNDTVDIYVGSGCFWGRQHDLVTQFERAILNRSDAAVTATGGYAGGRPAPGGDDLCYYNSKNLNVYEDLGHAEVVRVGVPLDDRSLFTFFETYFGAFVEISSGVWAREDMFDLGAGYRALIGFPKAELSSGATKTVVGALRRANNATQRRMKLVESTTGSDPDTYGTNTVYLMDSVGFPFHQAELCLQFHNNATGQYPPSYHALQQELANRGALRNTTCPIPPVC